MLAKADLTVGGGDASAAADIKGPFLDLVDAVERGGKNDDEGAGDGLDDNGAATALRPVDDHEAQHIEGVLEHEQQDDRRLGGDHVGEHPYHFLRRRRGVAVGPTTFV